MRSGGTVVAVIVAGAVAMYLLGGDPGGSSGSGQTVADTGVSSSDPATEPEPQQVAEIDEGTAWHVSESASPIDDSLTVALSVSSSEPLTGRYGRKRDANLIIRCKENTTSLFMRFGGHFMTDNGQYGRVTLRIDDNKSFTSNMSRSTDHEALGLWRGGQSIPLVKRLLDAETLTVRATPYNESAVTVIFPIDGLADEIVPLREACHW